MLQGEKGEPGAVFGADGRVLPPAQKGAKVSGLLASSPRVGSEVPGTAEVAWTGLSS